MWPILIRSFLDRGELSHRCLDKLVGRLSFHQKALFGNSARNQIRPLYSKMRRRFYNARMSRFERDALLWRNGVIAEFTPRLAVPRPPAADWLVYTDAAAEPPTLRELLFRG